MKLAVLDSFPNLAAGAKAVQDKKQGNSSDQQALMFLPGMNVEYRAMPNHLARSAIFAPVARGKKLYHHQTVLSSRRDALITYTGWQLDESQADAWMQLIFEAKDSALGQPVKINRAAFLRSIGRSTSGRDYQWLKSTMIAFSMATIVVEAFNSNGTRKYLVGSHSAFHMLSEFDFDADTDNYSFSIGSCWKMLFSGREYLLVDWEKRLSIKPGQDMAKALQRLVATSSDKKQQYRLSFLKSIFQYRSPMHKFRHAVRSAIDELKRVRVIFGGDIRTLKNGEEYAVLFRIDSGD